MVTANRPELAARAVDCFARQTYANRELVIVDDGKADYTSMIALSPEHGRIRYHKLDGIGQSLGELRNISIDVADGDWVMQWDDDEWYHSTRIAQQLRGALDAGVGASALRWTLMRVPAEDGAPLVFRGDSGLATPGTILFRKSDVRYPSLRRNEDGVFLRRVREALGLHVLGREHAHLFVREFHGSNTWDRDHFMGKLRRTPVTWPSYAWAAFVRRDITRMGRFRLSELERETAHDMECWRPLVGRPT